MPSTMYGISCLWHFLFNYILERPQLQILSIKQVHFHAQSIKASPVVIACKTAKMFVFFFTDQLNVDTL